jgi:hypothetical protein
VFFYIDVSRDEAVIVARDESGEVKMMVVLTNMAEEYAEGSIKSPDELRQRLMKAITLN